MQRFNRSRACCRQYQTSPLPGEVPGHSPWPRHVNPLNSVFCGTLTTKMARKRRSTGCCWDPQSGDIFYLIFFVTVFLSPLTCFSIFIFLLLSTSHLLLNKIHTVDLSIWSCLHLSLGRGISLTLNNWIITGE